MMDINQIDTQRWKTILQSKRVAFITLTIVLVVGGLVLDQIYFSDVRLGNPQTLVLPMQTTLVEQSNNLSDTTPVVELQPPPAPSWQSFLVRKGNTLGSLLKAQHINNTDIAAVLALPAAKTKLAHLKIGEQVELLQNEQHALLGLRYKTSATQTLDISRQQEAHFVTQIISQPITKHKVATHGVVRGTLYQSATRAGAPTKIAKELSDIFGQKVNFAKELHAGDKFHFIYEDEYVGAKKINTGNIVAATLELQNTTYRAVRFIDAQGHINYYTPDGQSLKSGFMRTPVRYTRISSGFALNRMQPLLHINRPHYGVDLSAPRGTPIDAAGDGVISFVGRDKGYGNYIIINHGHGITTRYGHIQKFAKGIHPGMHVDEGQLIAYVGSTGLATGPHLHYEYRINGTAYDPLRVKLPGGSPIKPAYKQQFLREARKLMVELDTPRHTELAAVHVNEDDV